MNATIIEDTIIEYEPFEEDGSGMMASETFWRGFAIELQELHNLKGARFVNQLKLIVSEGEFHSIKGENNIFSAISEQSDDFDNLINAARKAVEHGYRVYILPNPLGFRTADFIFERKGIFKMYDLKTVRGQSSVFNRLLESIGQTNNVLLNMTTDYNVRQLAKDIRRYFQMNSEALEVLIFKGNRSLQVKRVSAESKDFIVKFIKAYHKK